MADDAFRTQVDELAAGLKSRAKVVAHLKTFLADNWDQWSSGPPDLEPMSMTQLAFLLLLDDRWDDFVDYLQAIWDRMFNDIPERGDDVPRLTIGSIHGLTPPVDGAETWELRLQVDRASDDDDEDGGGDSGAVITHKLAGWEVTETTGTF